MPLPMVHLSVAVCLFEKNGLFPSPEFLLGNIAPDAIHVRPSTDQKDKQRVHLYREGASLAELVRTFRKRCAPAGFLPDGFSAGYLTHLLTDLLWKNRVIAPFRRKLPANLTDAEVGVHYYRDTNPLDIELYRRAPWRPQAWDGLARAAAMDFAGLLSGAEILQWRDRTLAWFVEHDHDPLPEPVFICLADTQNFIRPAAEEIETVLFNPVCIESLSENYRRTAF